MLPLLARTGYGPLRTLPRTKKSMKSFENELLVARILCRERTPSLEILVLVDSRIVLGTECTG